MSVYGMKFIVSVIPEWSFECRCKVPVTGCMVKKYCLDKGLKFVANNNISLKRVENLVNNAGLQELFEMLKVCNRCGCKVKMQHNR